MNSQTVKRPDRIARDLDLALRISVGLEKGDRSLLEKIVVEQYALFIGMARKKVFSGVDPDDAVQSFCQEVLLKGNIFRTYNGDKNCSLKSYLVKALIKFVYTENEKAKKLRGIEIIKECGDIPKPKRGWENPDRLVNTNNQTLRTNLKNKNIRRFVDNLLRTAIDQVAEKICLKFFNNDLYVVLFINSIEQNYLPRPDSRLLPVVIPRLKFIAGLTPSENGVPQRGSLVITNSARKVFLLITTQPDQHGCEVVEITLREATDADTLSSVATDVSDPSCRQTDLTDNHDEDADPEEEAANDSSASAAENDSSQGFLKEFFEDIIDWNNNETDNGPNPLPRHYSPAGSQQEETLEKKESVRFCIKIFKEAFSRLQKTHPEDAELIKLRMEEMEFADIAIYFESDLQVRTSLEEIRFLLKTNGMSAIETEQDPTKRQALQESNELLKQKTDFWKHRYERKDGPSALHEFSVILERLLVERKIQLDTSSLHRVENDQGEEEEMKKLLDEALGTIRREDKNMAKIAEIQLSTMRHTEIALLLGTINGRKITTDADDRKSPELKALQKALISILMEKGLELTSKGGKPRIRKIDNPVTATSGIATEIEERRDNAEESETIAGKKRAKQRKQPVKHSGGKKK